MKKYQELIMDIQLLDAELEMLQASNEAGGDIFDFNEEWLLGGENNG